MTMGNASFYYNQAVRAAPRGNNGWALRQSRTGSLLSLIAHSTLLTAHCSLPSAHFSLPQPWHDILNAAVAQ